MARRPEDKRSSIHGEMAVVAILFFGVAGIAFWQFQTSFAEQDAHTGGPFDNAAMFPRLVAWGLVLLGTIEMARLIIRIVRTRPDDGDDTAGGTAPRICLDTDEPPHVLTVRALGCAACFVLYLSTVTIVGYIAATLVLMTSMALILGARWWMAILVALAATFGIGVVFNTILNVVLPVGRLGLPTVF